MMTTPTSTSNGLIGDRAPSTRGAIAFAVAALVGATAIVGGKFLGLGQFQITLLPLAVMAIYTIVVLAPKFRLRNDSTGDNLYYLGFLYTLTSISVALYSFASDDSGPQIITNFGIAIATTVFGLALRIMLNQMRLDPAEVERSSRLELAEASRRMRRELDDVALELSVFRRSVIQSSQDYARETQDTLNDTLKSGLKDGGEKAKIFYGELQALHKEVVDSLKSITDDTKSVAQSIKAVSKQLTKIQTPDKVLEMNFEPTFKTLEELVSDFRESQNQSGQQLTALLAEFQQQNELITESLNQMSYRISAIADFASSREVSTQQRHRNSDLSSDRRRKSSKWNILRFFRRR